MANYDLIVNSQFKPFSYQEMLAPVLMATQAHQDLENIYGDLSSKADTFYDMANEQTSPEAYKMYKTYADDLAAKADQLSREGLNTTSRRDMLNMRKRYSREITPIENAYNEMKAANELRIKAGPDAAFEVSSYNSIDPFLHGRMANNKYISKDALTKKTAAMTEAAFLSELQDPDFKKRMGDQFWEIIQHTGGSYADLKEALRNNPMAQNKFMEIKSQIMKDVGYDRYDIMGKQAIEDAINTGLYAGLDKPARSFQANQDHITPIQKHQMDMDNKRLALEREKFEWQKQQEKRSGTSGSSSRGSSGNKSDNIIINREKEPIYYNVKKGRGANRGGIELERLDSSAKDFDKSGYTQISYDSLGEKTKRAIQSTYPNDDAKTAYSYFVKYTSEDANDRGYNGLLVVPRETKTINDSGLDLNELGNLIFNNAKI